MLTFKTIYGKYGNFKNMLLFMQEEHIDKINILKVTYCLNEIIGKGIYTFEQIKKLANA